MKINDKFVRLADMDEVLCQSLGLTVSSNEYLIPEGNTVNWVDMLASVILNLPSSAYEDGTIDINDVIDAVCHNSKTDGRRSMQTSFAGFFPADKPVFSIICMIQTDPSFNTRGITCEVVLEMVNTVVVAERVRETIE